MDHDDAGGVDLDFIAGRHNKGAAGHGDSVHDAFQLSPLCSQIPQTVVDQDGHTSIAANAVHADCQGLCPGNRLQIFQKFRLNDI